MSVEFIFIDHGKIFETIGLAILHSWTHDSLCIIYIELGIMLRTSVGGRQFDVTSAFVEILVCEGSETKLCLQVLEILNLIVYCLHIEVGVRHVLDESFVFRVVENEVYLLVTQHAELNRLLDKSISSLVFDNGSSSFFINPFYWKLSFTHYCLNCYSYYI